MTLPEIANPKRQQHRIKQAEHCLQIGLAYKNYNQVFASEIGKPLRYRNPTQSGILRKF